MATDHPEDTLFGDLARFLTFKQIAEVEALLLEHGWLSPTQAKERLDGAYVASLPAMEPRMVWQVTYEKMPSSRTFELLGNGWEPFAVTTQLDVMQGSTVAVYHYRRQVAAV